MRITVIFGMNQIVSHGFGVFLFAALVPLMRDSIAITHWHLAAIGALTQLSYLGGAMLLGLIGHRLGTARLALITGTVTTVLLFTMSQLQDPLFITLVLTCLAASAAISWGAIVEIVSRCARPELRSTCLSSASSGTAWGFGLNGLLILLVVPVFGWQSSWQIAALVGILVVGLTWHLLRGLKELPPTRAYAGTEMIPASKLLATILSERTALSACVICFLVGFATMPFSTWLNTYLNELRLPAALGGYTWSAAGATGMVAGFMTGKLADRKGHGMAFMVIFSGFALGLLAFIYDPASYALIAGFGYGLMYFPMWGLVAGWLNQTYSSTATMQINGICMVTFGLGGTLGNLLAGYIRDTTGSLHSVYFVLTAAALLLVMLALLLLRSSPKQNLVSSHSVADACRAYQGQDNRN